MTPSLIKKSQIEAALQAGFPRGQCPLQHEILNLSPTLFSCDVQEVAKKVPHHFELVSQKKGVKRFMSPQLRRLLVKRAEVLEEREAAMAHILQVTFQSLWHLLPAISLTSTAWLHISFDLGVAWPHRNLSIWALPTQYLH